MDLTQVFVKFSEFWGKWILATFTNLWLLLWSDEFLENFNFLVFLSLFLQLQKKKKANEAQLVSSHDNHM